MGLLVDGQWQDKWYDTESTGGRFKRSESQFRNWLGDDGFAAESGRYHLYVSYACPWAHRTLIFRQLKQLQDHIDVSVVTPLMLEHGWEFADGERQDKLYQHDFLYQLYLQADSNYSGRVTVPVLWDKKRQTIVSNESADIIRMFNSAFNTITGNHDDYYPEPLQNDINELNEWIYSTVNNGVYKCGFATQQDAYEEAYAALFKTLSALEQRLQGQRYLLGDRLTEADWRLFTTLVRFDAVYFGHFKTNHKRIVDYPNLWGYVRDLYQHPGVRDTVVMSDIKQHYYGSHKTINPTGIIPVGPQLDFLQPPQRQELSQ
ncbi:glutathione S-transferase family protein [Idiomarina xiamenensis]|uniref:Glutathione S-transferase n=1 Tax=Idiomarina xiamenensis 10-D-4 TaxID=740709 RepID=K2L4T4_9GAMM|nr:glutathione S-transferase family protein [Idiomarina xiamenensis]EKE84835.1 glutathione S-transferase [Idiomarina xiamenensis 10-D-4]